MARDVESLVVSLSADIKRFESELRRANDVTNKQARAIENRWRQANKNMDGIGRSMAQSIVAPLAGIGAVLGTREIMSYADAWTRAGNLIAAAGQVAGRSGRSLEGIVEIANNTRAAFGETADLYARILRSTAGVATSEKEVAQATETVNKAFKAGGAATSEMTAGILQLSQGLSSGLLSGDELRSVRENAPLLAQAIADYFGTTIGGLKKLGAEGKLTSEKVFQAILAAKSRIDSAFNATAQTISDAVTKVNNAFIQFIGQSDESLGAADRLKAALNALADNFDNVADVTIKVAGIIAGALVGRSIVGMIAKLGLATQAVTTFVAALRTASIATALGGLGAAAGPIGLLIGGTVATALALYYSNTKEATAGSKEYAAALKQVEAAAKAAAPAVDAAGKSAANAANEAFAAAARTATAELESNVAPALQLFDQIMESLRGADPVGEKQADSVRKLIVEVSRGQAPVAALRAALEQLSKIDAFALLARDLQALLPKIDAAASKFKDVGDQLKLNQLQKEFSPFDEVARQEERQRKLRADGEAYLKDARERNSLSKQQLAIEEEIAKIRKDPKSAGLSDKEVRGLAQENIAANDRRAAEGRKAPRTAESRFEQDIQSVRDRTAALIEEQRIVGLSVSQQESRRMAMDLEQQALRNLREEARRNNDENWRNVQLSQEQKDAIAQVSAAYGEQAAALERVREAHQRAEQLASEFYDTFKSGIAEAITGAKSLDEALQGVLKRLGDLLINAAFDSLFKPPGSGAGGVFGKLFGFDDGGYTGAGGKYQPAGVVHKGEYVFDQAAVRAAGGPAALDAMRKRLKGYADGGFVGGLSVPKVTAPRAGGASGGITYAPVIDARGADTAAVARLEEVMRRDRAEFEARVVKTVRQAGQGRQLR